MSNKQDFSVKNDKHSLYFRDQGSLGLVRAQEGSNEPTKLVGYAVVFNSESYPVGIWRDGREVREIIDPAALDEALAGNPDVRALFSHSRDKVLGRTKAGTLKLSKDTRGLRIEISLVDTTLARDVAADVEAGNIDGMSFGFWPDYETMEYVDKGDYLVQVIRNIRILDEVSVVAYPAYPATTVQVRELKEISAPVIQEQPNLILSQFEKRRLELTKNKLKLCLNTYKS